MSCKHCATWVYFDDKYGNSAVIDYDGRYPRLNIESDDAIASVAISYCPWCGEKLKAGKR